MKTTLSTCWLATILLGTAFLNFFVTDACAADKPARDIRLLIVTGGHGFEEQPFFAMFNDLPGIEWQHVTHPDAHAYLAPEKAKDYDVLVLYDMWQEIDDSSKQHFTRLLRSGKGVLALHHCLASYQDWPEYQQIIGGKYHLEPSREGDKEHPGSTFKHDVQIPVEILKPGHPVTRGLEDFIIHDETYGHLEVLDKVTPLLGTDEPTSSPVIAWSHSYEASRIVYLQLGHDHHAYQDPHFRRLVSNALHYVAHKREAGRR